MFRREPTDKAAIGPDVAPSDGFIAACPCCDAEIHVRFGSAVEVYDIFHGTPYGVGRLPRRVDGRRVLVCLWCIEDAEVIARAGHQFEAELLREAKVEKLDAMVAMSDMDRLHQHVVELRRESMHVAASRGVVLPAPVAGPKDEGRVTPEDCARLEGFERALLLRCYREAARRRAERLAEAVRLRRRAALDLRVAGAGVDDAVPF
ncbi:MAG: hypothetical protein JNJ54_04660 [Myxococcaceae bacterium]|nr:hypothetical protein [Myxococcaceae bacterium]